MSSVSPPPGPIVVQALGPGWSNVAHLAPPGATPAAFAYLPGDWNAVFHWSTTKDDGLGGAGAFNRFDREIPAWANDWSTVATYDAFWVDASGSNIATLNPNPPLGRTLALSAGWNNFAYTGTNRSVADALSDIDGKYLQVMRYDNATSTWDSYLPGQPRFLNDFGGLFNLQAYWILVSEPVLLVMD